MLPLDMAVPASTEIIENATTFGEIVHCIGLFSKEIANKIEIEFDGFVYTKDADLDSESKKAITQFVAKLSQFHNQEPVISPKSSKKDLTYKKTPTSEQDTNPKPSEEVLTYKKTPTSDPIAVPKVLLNTLLPKTEYVFIADFLGHTSLSPLTLAQMLGLDGGHGNDIRGIYQREGSQMGFLTCLNKYKSHNPYAPTLEFFIKITASKHHAQLVEMAEAACKKTEQENSRKATYARRSQQVAKEQEKKTTANHRAVFGPTASSSTASNASNASKSVKSVNESKLSKLGLHNKDKQRNFIDKLAEHNISLDKLENTTLDEVPRSAFPEIASKISSLDLLTCFFGFTDSEVTDIKFLGAVDSIKAASIKALNIMPNNMNLLNFCIKMTNAADIDCLNVIIDQLIFHEVISISS